MEKRRFRAMGGVAAGKAEPNIEAVPRIKTVKNRLAHLRWLAEKIGKPGIVRGDNASYELRGRRAGRALNRDLLQLWRRVGGGGSHAARRDCPHLSARLCSATSGATST